MLPARERRQVLESLLAVEVECRAQSAQRAEWSVDGFELVGGAEKERRRDGEPAAREQNEKACRVLLFARESSHIDRMERRALSACKICENQLLVEGVAQLYVVALVAVEG